MTSAPGKDTSVRFLLQSLQPWLDDTDITEIAINRPGEVWTEKHNKWNCFDLPSLTLADLHSLATAVAAFADNTISALVPRLSAILPDGERIQFVIPPACEAETVSVTIRKPGTLRRSLDDYQRDGYFDHVRPVSNALLPHDEELLTLRDSDRRAFFARAIELNKTIIVSGSTGSGKTTLMKALIDLIPSHIRIITIEDVAELFLPKHPNHVHLFYPSEADQDDPVTPAILLKSCLRMKPDRILLAELRGAETFDFINVAASGHGGSITSCHAGSAALTFERLAMMVMQNPQGRMLPYDVVLRLLHQVVDIVVHVDNDVHSQDPVGRHITEIWFDPHP